MSKGYLTTHVLDTFNGKPGSGIKASIYIIEETNKKKFFDPEKFAKANKISMKELKAEAVKLRNN